MFYLLSSSPSRNEYGVVDTRDGILEYVTEYDLLSYKKKGVQIVSDGFSNLSEFRGLNTRMIKDCYNACMSSQLDARKFLREHTLPSYDLFLRNQDMTRKDFIKLYDYSDTEGYFIFYFELQPISTNKDVKFFNVALVYEDKIKSMPVPIPRRLFKFGTHPIGTGWYHQDADKKDYGLHRDTIYLRLCSLEKIGEITFIRLPDFKPITVKKY